MKQPDWEQGACHSQPELTHLFYSDNRTEQEAARAICWECPIQQECLGYAMTTKEKFGMWGGLLPAERKRLKINVAAA